MSEVERETLVTRVNPRGVAVSVADPGCEERGGRTGQDFLATF